MLADALLSLPAWLLEDPDIAVARILTVGMVPGERTGWQGISPFVTPSVLWSLYAALRHLDDYVWAVSTAIAAGGDADTAVAMTGAIVGCAVGLEGLPTEMAQRVHDGGQEDFVSLCELGARLLRVHESLGKAD